MNIYPPNTFQIPNIVVDQWLPYLTGSQLIVLIFFIKKSQELGSYRLEFGFLELEKLLGLTYRTINQSIKFFVEKGIIKQKIIRRHKTVYELIPEAFGGDL